MKTPNIKLIGVYQQPFSKELYEKAYKLKFLLEKNLIEERRDEINRNYDKSLKELKNGKLKFTNDINKLKEMIEE